MNIIMAPMYRAHCAVIFAIAQLSCTIKKVAKTVPNLARVNDSAAQRNSLAVSHFLNSVARHVRNFSDL